MRYVQVNTYSGGSTGSVMARLHDELREQGEDSYIAWARGRDPENDHELRIGTMVDVCVHGAYVRATGRMGFASSRATKEFLAWLDEIDPDVVHLHNIHGYYINIEMLFKWLARHRCQVKWTLHDCWAFTGHCAHFTYVKCAQWTSHCAYEEPCCQLSTYPKTFSKRSCARNFEDKKRLFNLIPSDRMTLITPSQWLADLVKRSFLSKYPVEVRRNVVDASVFKPTPSDFRERYGIGDRFMILGIANPWTERKGLDDFMRLANELDDAYTIVLVGLSRKQIRGLPHGTPARIVGIGRTESKEELAAIYTAANLFFNPTKEDNYPTVNLEAQACGTPVVVYDVGGCGETIGLSGGFLVHGYDSAVWQLRKMRVSHE